MILSADLNTPPLLEMRSISKGFGAVQALRDVDLVLHEREVLGLVGDNAAGKSTLMKILTGAYHADAGEILLDGHPAHFASPEDSRRAGIEMVYQDLALADNLDVADNVFLGREHVRFRLGPFGVMNKRAMRAETGYLLERLEIPVPPIGAKVRALSGGQRQSIAIARATAFDARIVIMDEPTAAMSVAAIDKILDLIEKLESALILISHRLEDIHRVAHRVMVMRHGRNVGEMRVSEDVQEFREEVVSHMIGARGGSETVAPEDANA